ncbi:MAG: S-layer homology domain-containing protein [Firmicutes bacterium]|nr:S-layer homology domain-containing protein [Bacillota bacterium]
MTKTWLITGVSGGLGGGRGAAGFADVPPTHWAYDTVTRLETEGVLGGVDGSAFQPDRTVTRAEFAALLAKALKLPAPGASSPGFVDVTFTDWFYDAVLRVAAAGLMRGIGNGRFAPELGLDREAAAVVATILGAGRPPAADSVAYSDLGEASEWALQAIVEAARRGLLRGYPDGTFQPQRGLTRAEAAVLVLRLRP